MAGKIKAMIDEIVQQRAKGNKVIEGSTRAKLVMKGINIESYDENSPDDPDVINKLEEIAEDFDLQIKV